eukprot:gb/GECG01012519.1/.p1 GENE.gb/GECG01012519.1/~~gb/GECG01012519.1/.p1  ORF type:complete len:1843 (+),score=156.00 gb/GECG01012519.1/:1-5529(+)
MDQYCGGGTQWRYITIALRNAATGSSETSTEYYRYGGKESVGHIEGNALHQPQESDGDPGAVIDACAGLTLIQASAIVHFLFILQVLVAWSLWPICKRKYSGVVSWCSYCRPRMSTRRGSFDDDEEYARLKEELQSSYSPRGSIQLHERGTIDFEEGSEEDSIPRHLSYEFQEPNYTSSPHEGPRATLSSIGESTHEEEESTDEYSKTANSVESPGLRIQLPDAASSKSTASTGSAKGNVKVDAAGNTGASDRAGFVSFLAMSLGYGLWAVIGILGMTTASNSSLQGESKGVHTASTNQVPFLMSYYGTSFGGGILGICGLIVCAREGTTKPVQGFLFKASFVLPCLFFAMYLHRLGELSHGYTVAQGGVVIGKQDTEHSWALSTTYCFICMALLATETSRFIGKSRQNDPHWTYTYSEWITFSWLSRLINIGEQRQLEERDLDPLPDPEATVPCARRFENEVFRLRSTLRDNASITHVIWNLYSWPWLALGLLQLLNAASSFAGPLLIKELLQFLQSYPGTPLEGKGQSSNGKCAFANASNSPWIALMVGIAMCLNAVVSAVSQTQFGYNVAKLQTRVRAGLLNTIFKVGLTMSRFDWHYLSRLESVDDGSSYSKQDEHSCAHCGSVSGTLVNLLSVDTQKVLTALSSLHQLWSLPVQVVVTLYLLWLQVSWAFFAGLGVLVIFLPINLFVSKRIGDLTREMMEFRDERLRVCEDALKNMSLIKMQRLEVHFNQRIKAIREQEVSKLKARKYWDALCVYLWAATPVLVSLATFASAALSGHMRTYDDSSADKNLTTAEVFTSLSLLQMLIVPMNAFPWVITGIMEARVSVKRFNRILFHANVLDILLGESKGQLSQEHLVVPWSSIVWPSEAATIHSDSMDHNPSFVLSIPQQITLNTGELVVVVGRVGAGKTAFLRSLFADMLKANSNESSFVSFASYAPQRPWIREDSVYRNITCCGPHLQHEANYFRDERYGFVKFCTALEEDIEEMPFLDRTNVGEKGSTLSGGQQQRIGIARALYSSCSVLILDDPLSALDAFVKAQVRDHAILGIDTEEFAGLSANKKGSLVRNRTRIVATHEESVIQRCDKIIGLEKGTLIFTGTRKDFFDEIESSDLASRLGIKSEKLFQPVTKEFSGKSPINVRDKVNGDTAPTFLEEEEEDAEEFREAGHISLHVLGVYIRAMGRIVVVSLLLFLFLMQVTRNGSDYWLSQWSDALPSETDNSNGGSAQHSNRPWVRHQWSSTQFLHVYIAIAVFNTVFTVGRSWLFAYGGVQGARKMHNQLLESVLVAKMQFFQKNPVGRILNRFSSDQLNVDETLPFQANILLAQLFGLLGTCAVILYASTGWLFLAVLPIGFLYWRTQKRYRFTSRELRRLESILRSPLYSHFGDCLSEEGSAVIRAGGPSQVNREADKLLELIDRSQRAWFATNAAVQWLSFRLQCIGVLAISFVAGFAVFRRLYRVDAGDADSSSTNTEAGAAGLALSYALPIVDSLQGILNSFAETEKEMVSVERQSEYIKDAKPEQDPTVLFGHEDNRCCDCHLTMSPRTNSRRMSWSQTGDSLASPLLEHEDNVSDSSVKRSLLSVRGLYVRYKDPMETEVRGVKGNLAWVLKGISFDAERGEHIGICGRTGSGKSTIFSTLFRLVEHSHGHVFIEGQDISELSLSSLRSKISIIPQEPLLFEGTVGDNLDPEHSLPTNDLQVALEKCKILKNSKNEEGIGKFSLDDYIASSGSNLSMGLRQLMCLARCILQQQSLVCIDEATASVDSRTATHMNGIIRSVFKKSGATVIVIAHRPESLFQCDRLLVMEGGKIIETGAPESLSRDTASAFYHMYGRSHGVSSS